MLVAADYYSPLDPSGKRSDLPNNPELKHGTVDFVVPMEYWAQPAPPRLLPLYSDNSQLDSPSESNSLRPPQPMSTLFMIDVSQTATSSGLVAFLCNSIREVLYGSDAGNPFENRLVGFMTFDSTLHFYNISVRGDIHRLS
jgi:protein transport protein SEC24